MVTTAQAKTLHERRLQDSALHGTVYTLDMLRNEARELVDQGLINVQTPIYTLCRFISPRERHCVEITLEAQEFLLRDRICDLLSHESWDND